ncbi:MAG: 2-C-methyl-D-erythritol 4-phosphate cytidylyltransferase [Armatimonadota bacterium]|nr:2-C-methyl-D-erythritol 4-phosphate cytidylyltransferase [Armatimonadota bacterium]
MRPTCAAVVPAAGKGERVGSPRNKLLLPLCGKAVLARTLAVLDRCPDIQEVVVAARAEDVGVVREVAVGAVLSKPVEVVTGGATRQDSVYRALQATHPGCELVAVHDGARPLVTPEQVAACIAAAARVGGALLALPVTDTLKEVCPRERRVQGTLNRDVVWAAQTPQVFRRDWLMEAHQRAAADGYLATDDCDLVTRLNYPVEVVPGSGENLKITTAGDFLTAEWIVRQREGFRLRAGAVRVGFGFDAHRLEPGRPLVLGGVNIPYPRGLAGHSDADVVLHALVDALLGAIAAGDIGQHFPPTNEAYRDADSRHFLRYAGRLVRERGMQIVAVDATLIAQAPKIAPYVPQMRAEIAAALEIDLDQVSVKATTTEGMGFTGSGEGMAAQAVATVCEREEGGNSCE